MTARTLTLVRTESGPTEATRVTGKVAEITVFSDGVAVLHWLTNPGATEVYASERDLRKIREFSGRSELREDRPLMPDGARYTLYVAMDPRGASSPDGSGDRTREVASLDEAIAFLLEAAGAGCEYVCLEILKYRPPDPLARPVEEVPLP